MWQLIIATTLHFSWNFSWKIGRCATWFQRELCSQGQGSNVKVPHLARKQGVSTEFVLIEKVRVCKV